MRLPVSYGKDPFYWQSAYYQLANHDSGVPISLATDQPDRFVSLDRAFELHHLTPEQVNEWSLGGRYHFRVKSQAILHCVEQMSNQGFESFLFNDTDIEIRSTEINRLMRRIDISNCLLFRNEGRILSSKRFAPYHQYVTDSHAEMWGSAVIGMKVAHCSVLRQADELMLSLIDRIDAHTVEQFSLAQTANAAGLKLIPTNGKTKHFSTSSRRRFAQKILESIFSSSPDSWAEQCRRANLIRSPLQTDAA